jgi:DUF4097 and DUF4098 domain-containing protein YvlB
MKKSLLVLPFLVAAVSACNLELHAEPVTEREEKSFTVSGRPDVTLITFDGSIEVRSWDRNEVAVTIERRAATVEAAKSLEVRTDQKGDRVLVEVVQPKGADVHFGLGPSASLRVSVPRTSNVEARSGDGSIRIDDVTGRVSLRSGDGSIAGTALAGVLDAHTGDGSISLDRVSGRIKVDTGDGSVNVAGVVEALQARTGDGSITVRAADESTAVEDWDLSTGDGGMTIELPRQFDAEVDARTGDGRISVEGLDVVRASGGDSEDRDELRGRLGAGGKTLRLRTGDGSIRLRQIG